MIRARFRRLEEILGAPITDALTDEHLQRLVDAGTTEADDLDFKLCLYEKTEPGRAELAKDVAAFANHIGGVMVLGVAEVKGTASKVVPVEGVDDGEERRIRSVVGSRVHPWLTIEVVRCRSKSDPNRGFMFLVVPRSPRAPHAVNDPGDPGLRYFVRHGTQTLPMNETMVADRYRSRFEAARARLERVDQVMAEGAGRLQRREVPWVALAVVPEAPGDFPLDAAGQARLREWASRLPPKMDGQPPLPSGVTIGARRVYLGDQPYPGDQLVRGVCADLHTDGSVFFAQMAWQTGGAGTSQPFKIVDGFVVDVVAAGLRLAARHALDNTSAGGEALVEAAVLEVRTEGSSPTHSMELHWAPHLDGGIIFPDRFAKGRARFTVTPSRHTVDLAVIADSATEWMVATRLVANDLLQAFGMAETPQIRSDGALRLRYLGERANTIAAWAKQVGIPLDDSSFEP